MTNPNNTCVFTGTIPTTDKLRYEFYNDDENISRCRMNGYINVKRNYKKKDEEYYPNDLIKFVVFGPSARYMDQYVKRGDVVTLAGSIEKEPDYEKDGQKYYGQLFLRVEGVSKPVFNNTDDSNNNKNNSSSNSSGLKSGLTKLKRPNPLMRSSI